MFSVPEVVCVLCSSPSFLLHHGLKTSVINFSSPIVTGHGCRDPAGTRRATGKHENTGSQSEPQAPALGQQPDSAQKETAGVSVRGASRDGGKDEKQWWVEKIFSLARTRPNPSLLLFYRRLMLFRRRTGRRLSLNLLC